MLDNPNPILIVNRKSEGLAMMSSIRTISPLITIDPVEEGSEWEWTSDVSCRSGVICQKGSRAKIIEKTGMYPHGEMMERGYNLLVNTNGSTTVWATFEQCISRGLLRRI